jgi:hypothetical protein
VGKGTKRIWVYVWALPVIWFVLTFWSIQSPGGQYGFAAIGTLPAVYLLIAVHAIVGGLPSGMTVEYTLLLALVTGPLLMFVVGYILDRLRASGPLFATVYFTTAFCVGSLLLFIQPQREHWTAQDLMISYLLFALLMGLYAAIIVSTAQAVAVRLHCKLPRDIDNESQPI